MFRQGAQGAYDGASNGILESEFGTSVDDEVIKQILEKGTLQESQVCFATLLGGAAFTHRRPRRNTLDSTCLPVAPQMPQRNASRNDADGAMVAH